MGDLAIDVMDVTTWEVVTAETAGATAHDWLADPATGVYWLFKPVTVKNGQRYGEDWAEKAVSELARALHLPCATVRLASRGGVEGALVQNLRPIEYELQPGHIAMDAYPIVGFCRGNVKGRPGHSLPNIQRVLADVHPPPGSDVPDAFRAFDVFCGYIMLDALTANRDRHDENWAVLIPYESGAPMRLCGSYDHGNSMGYNLREEELKRRLAHGGAGVDSWAAKGTAWRLEHDPSGPPMSLVRASSEGFLLAGNRARLHWLGRLEGLDAQFVESVLAGIPTMLELSRRFVARLMETNRRRILDECAQPA